MTEAEVLTARAIKDLRERVGRIEAALATYLGENRDANFAARDKALRILHEAE